MLIRLRFFCSGEPFSFRDLGSVNLQDKPGVYVIFNERNEAIYVGRTRNLRRRLLRDHRRGNVRGSQFRKALMQNYGFKNEDEISSYIDQKCRFKFKEIEDPAERIRLEHFAIAILAPALNIKLKY